MAILVTYLRKINVKNLETKNELIGQSQIISEVESNVLFGHFPRHICGTVIETIRGIKLRNKLWREKILQKPSSKLLVLLVDPWNQQIMLTRQKDCIIT